MGNFYKWGYFGTFLSISIQTYLYKWGSGEWGPKRFRDHFSNKFRTYTGRTKNVMSYMCPGTRNSLVDLQMV